MKSIFYIGLLSISNMLLSQEKPIRYNPLQKPNTYRNLDNPNYWANKKPYSDYWQQDVYYQIKANINEQKDWIEGSEILTYWNNSPDDLNEIYFHLYQNAFQPESHLHELNSQNNNEFTFAPYKKEKKGIIINQLTSAGRRILLEQDNTILKAYLNKPIKPGESIVFEIKFTTYFGKGDMGRRIKKFNSNGKTHYNGANWYPRISVYDAKFGWTTDQNLGNEFYGDFGTFDVELTFASNYITEATGFLLNRDEVLPKSLRKKLDIKNFKDKPWNELASVITPYNSEERKTWKFHAENVHDFAFTADPSYRIGEASWNGITCFALTQEKHASKWQNAAEYAANIIKIFSQDIGMYTYHKMIVADAQDRMEYPMLTLVRGSDSSYRALLVHEIGHNWFYGQIGNNKTYRASLDEGFTQFLSAWSLEKIDSETVVEVKPKNKFITKHTKSIHPKDQNIYYPYIKDATKNNTPRLNNSSDNFHADDGYKGGYGHVYYKTAAMLYNLEYTLGDELFLKAIKNYFNTWKIAHPYFEDFKKSIIDFTKVDLNWFFDQWLESSKDIDYAIKSVKKIKDTPDSFEITFKRKGEMQMPLDFRVLDKAGNTKDYHIPNTWFIKKTDANVLNRWYGFGKIYPQHKVIIRSKLGIKDIIIDPSSRLADAYMIDNSLYKNISIELEDFVWSLPDWKTYQLTLQPRLAYNGYDGIKTGMRLMGDYMDYHHKFDGTFWINTGLNQNEEHLPSIDVPFDLGSNTLIQESKNINGYDRLSYQFNYETGLHSVNSGLSLNSSSRKLDGLNLHSIGLKQIASAGADLMYLEFKAINRPKRDHFAYLLNPEEIFWQTGQWNNTINIGIQHQYKYFTGEGIIDLSIRSSSIASDYQYSQLSFKVLNNFNFAGFQLKTRIFAQHATGTNIAPESKLYAAGANQEEMMENIFTRSTGLISRDWLSYNSELNHFHMGGGLNLRAYSGYVMPEGENLQQILSFNGTSGASFSTELEFDDNLNFFRDFNMKTYGFIDMGWININKLNQKLNLGSFRMDGGIGFSVGILEVNEKLIQFRIDLPWFMNKPPAGEDYFNFNRFVFGLNRSF